MTRTVPLREQERLAALWGVEAHSVRFALWKVRAAQGIEPRPLAERGLADLEVGRSRLEAAEAPHLRKLAAMVLGGKMP